MTEQDFGLFLLHLRKHVKQKAILKHLPGWSKYSYSRLEHGEQAPAFDQLHILYRALLLAGVSISPEEQQHFLSLARARLSNKKTHRDTHTEEEWAELSYDLLRLDQQYGAEENRLHSHQRLSSRLLADTSHILGRDEWRQQVKRLLTAVQRKKILILHGPAGIGKSSELNRLATSFLLHATHRPILCDFRAVEQRCEPEEALDILVSTVLTELGVILPHMSPPSLDGRVAAMLEQTQEADLPVVILIDHAEVILDARGAIAPCWQRFLSRCLRGQHQATFILATNQWPGWYGGELSFLAEVTLPPLTPEQGVHLLQQLGLARVAEPLLRQICEKVQGLPLCLEWVVALVKQPLLFQDWEHFSQPGIEGTYERTFKMTQQLQLLLAEPHIFAGPLSDDIDIAPLLERITANQRLSEDARQLLRVISLATLPLARPALELLCPNGPRPIQELRHASVLVAYPDRVQMLPSVAAAMLRALSSEERFACEERLIQAYSIWVRQGTFYENEKGSIIAELTTLFLTHHNLLSAAQLLIRYGWLAFRQGHSTRLAQLAEQVLHAFDWHSSRELESGAILLQQYCASFLGKVVPKEESQVAYHTLLTWVLEGSLTLEPVTEIAIVEQLMRLALSESRFAEDQDLLEQCWARLSADAAEHLEVHSFLLEKRAWLFSTWSAWAEEQGKSEEGKQLREQAIAVYQHCVALLAHLEEQACTSLQHSELKKRYALMLNHLSYQLHLARNYHEALACAEQSIVLQEQGYLDVGTLAAVYGEKSQILASLGRFQEALSFDEKAVAEIRRVAETGDTLSQEELWIYVVNRGRLYLQLGRIQEATRLLEEALPQIVPRRRTWRVFAHNALQEIQQWQQRTSGVRYQLDWRWIARYRQILSYPAAWWWTQTGPFSDDEQQQWDRLSTLSLQERLADAGKLLTQARLREIEQALQENRAPHFHYPALDIEDLHSRLHALHHLRREIQQHETHPIVRKIYDGAIEEECARLGMMEATYNNEGTRFYTLSCSLYPPPTAQEMGVVFSQLQHILFQGSHVPRTRDFCQQLTRFIQEQLQIDLSLTSQTETNVGQPSTYRTPGERVISASCARRFLARALRKHGYEDWLVAPIQSGDICVETATRTLYIPDRPLTVEQISQILFCEMDGHISRSHAGEYSLLGILALGTQHHLQTDEGLALALRRQWYECPLDETENWIGMLAVGLACGTNTPPLAFPALLTFFDLFFQLHILLKEETLDSTMLQRKARQKAIDCCLHTYLGTSQGSPAGICNTHGVIAWRGLQAIEQASTNDTTLLNRLKMGKMALEHLEMLQDLAREPVPISTH